MITKEQITRIHILKAQLGLSEYEYAAALSSYGVNTSKDLSDETAADLINKLNQLTPHPLRDGQSLKGRGANPDPDPPDGTRKKYDELGGRYNDKLKQYYATPKQLRMLEAMWMTSPGTKQKTVPAFKAFIKRISGKESIEWLMMSDVKKIKKAIDNL